MVFDTDSEVVEDQIRKQQRLPEIGTVTDVTVRDGEDVPSNHEVNVFLRDENHERRNIGIATNFNGHVRVPEVGDVVLVGFLDGDGEKPFVQDVIYTDKQRAPLAREGDWRLRINDSLYLEMSPTDDVARLCRKSGDDLSDPDATIEIDDSGSNPTINIETTGDVNINADGDIVLGDSTDAESLAIQNHTHPESDGGTTGTPNESGTSTQVE